MRFNNKFRQVPKGAGRSKNLYPYKNQFEKDIHAVLDKALYEDKKAKVAYTTESIYNPDFVLPGNNWLLLEAKGRFIGGAKESAKYVWVKRCNPKLEIVFIFQNHTTRMPGARRRKDGSYLTMGEWAAKNGFAFFQHKRLPQELIEATVTREYIEALKDTQYQTYFGKDRRK